VSGAGGKDNVGKFSVIMNDDETEQPLTDHLVDQFAAYFLMTMLAFHLYDYINKEYRKTKPPQ